MSIELSPRRDLAAPPWWSTLEALAEVAEASGIRPRLDPLDFSHCGTVERVGLPRLHLYQHVHTRRGLALDERLHAWRAAPGTPGAVSGYIPVASLADAVGALDLERGERMKSGPRRFVRLHAEPEENA